MPLSFTHVNRMGEVVVARRAGHLMARRQPHRHTVGGAAMRHVDRHQHTSTALLEPGSSSSNAWAARRRGEVTAMACPAEASAVRHRAPLHGASALRQAVPGRPLGVAPAALTRATRRARRRQSLAQLCLLGHSRMRARLRVAHSRGAHTRRGRPRRRHH